MTMWIAACRNPYVLNWTKTDTLSEMSRTGALLFTMMALSACPSPPTDDDAGLDDGGADAQFGTELGVELQTQLDGNVVERVLESEDGEVRVSTLRIGIESVEWKSDLGAELRMDVGQSIDLLGVAALPPLTLPPGRYSEVEIRLASGGWGPALEAQVDSVAVTVSEAFDVEARCEDAIDARAGEVLTIPLVFEGELILETLREAEDPEEALRESLKEARLICP